MASGGARLRSGPAPDPNALRRDRDGKDWVKLPHEGRTGDTPAWPEEIPEPSVAELAHWARLWKMPQALIWEADRVHDNVALYVRTFAECAATDGSVGRRTLLRQMGDALLLSIPALHAARYTIAPPVVDPDAEAREASKERHPAGKARTPKTGGARALLSVVEPVAGDEDATDDAPED